MSMAGSLSPARKAPRAGPITVAASWAELEIGSDGSHGDRVTTLWGGRRASSIAMTPPDE